MMAVVTHQFDAELLLYGLKCLKMTARIITNFINKKKNSFQFQNQSQAAKLIS